MPVPWMNREHRAEPVEVGQLVALRGQIFEVVERINWTQEEQTAREVENRLTNRGKSTQPYIKGVLRMTANYKTYSKFVIDKKTGKAKKRQQTKKELTNYTVIGKDEIDRRVKVLKDWAETAIQQAKDAEALFENIKYVR
jgi:hypothetical protein